MIKDKDARKALQHLEKALHVAREASYPFGKTEEVSETLREATDGLNLLKSYLGLQYNDQKARAALQESQEEVRTLRVHHNKYCTCGALM